ncbi:hypothetical protein ACO1O0_000432 [Amphichorda felina]
MDRGAFNSHHVRRADRGATTTASAAAAAAAAASRQKSCNACVRGKRRCDKVTPTCTRCAAKGLSCIYQRMPAGSSGPSSSASPVSSGSSESVPGGRRPGSGPGPGPGPEPGPTTATTATTTSTTTATLHHNTTAMNTAMPTDFDMPDFSIDACHLDPSTTSPDTLRLDPNLDFCIADLIGSSSHATSSLWTIPGFLDPKTEFPAPVPMMPPPCPLSPQAASPTPLHARQPIRDVTVFNDNALSTCIAMDPLLVHDVRSRVGFIVDYMTFLHASFARTRTMPCLHPRLYAATLPRTVMTAFCAATVYANRTPATKAWAIRMLADAACEIHAEGRGGSAAAPLSPLDKLARVQALCVVDTMRMFDGDISLRHAAEKERPILLEWVRELIELREELEEGEPTGEASRDRPPPSWDHWILLESARRTTILSLALICLVYVLKSEAPNPSIWQPEQAFTASRHLWEAATPADFFRAWREQPRWTIANGGFRDFWQYARAEDMDEFTKLMLTTQVGPDAMDLHFMQGEMSIPVS